MSFQQTLQGPRPTTSQQSPRQANTGGIDALTSAVKLGAQAIGSSYAESQAEAGYQNAFQQYTQAQQGLNQLETKLGKVTAQYYAQGKPDELLSQMSTLEDTVRRAKLGESTGKLSGLSMKARVESAYKQAVSRFPTFASELRAHRDATTSGGAIGASLEQSEIQLDLAKKEAIALTKSMNEYGLSYFNATDRLIFQSTERRMGEINRRNEFMKGNLQPLLTKLDIHSKILSAKQAEFNYNTDIEDRPGEIEKKATALEQAKFTLNSAKEDRPQDKASKALNYNKSKFEYERAQILAARQDEDRPGDIAQKKAQLSRTQYDALNNGERYTTKQSAKKVSQLVSDNLSELYSVAQQYMHEGAGQALNPDERKGYFENLANTQRTQIHQMHSRQGTVGSSEYTRDMSELESWKNSNIELATITDPLRAQKRLQDAKKVELTLDLYNDKNWKRNEMLKSAGMATVFTKYATMMADAEGDPTASGKSLKQSKARKFAEITGLDSIFPSQLQSDLRNSINAGKAVGNTSAVQGAAAIGMVGGHDMTNEELNHNDTRTLNQMAMDSRFGLDAMSSYGGLKFARASGENKAAYQRSYDKKIKETANMLPDGYGVEWRSGKFHIIKAAEEGGLGEVVATLDHNKKAFDPYGGQTAEAHGFDKWPLNYETDAPVLAETLKEFAWINENGGDVVITQPTMKDPNTPQNKGFFGTAGDLLDGASDFIANNIVDPAEVAVGIDVDTSFITEGYKTPEFNARVHANWQSRGKEYADVYNQAAAQSGVSIDLLIRQGSQESEFKADAKSHAGALGISQFMPATARAMGLRVDDEVDDRLDPTKSIYAQAKLMRELLNKYNGDKTLALVDYNGGPKAVKAWQAGKGYSESRGYIKRILGDG